MERLQSNTEVNDNDDDLKILDELLHAKAYSAEEVFNMHPYMRRLSPGLKKYENGLDVVHLDLKPFDIKLRDFYSQDELDAILADKNEEEVQKIIDQNREDMIYNTGVLDEFDEHIFQIAELTPEEKDALYNNKETGDSDKSILACLNAIDQYDNNKSYDMATDTYFENIFQTAQEINGFRILLAKKLLDDSDSHFKILSRKELEKVEPGSLEDIASGALESFAINRDFNLMFRIGEYDEYLYNMALDSMDRRVGLEKGKVGVKTSIDLSDFQDHIIESMNDDFILNSDSADEYSEEEFAAMQARVPKMLARNDSGYHFQSDQEKRIIGQEGREESIYWYQNDVSDEKDKAYQKDYDKNLRRLNKAVFEYNETIARVEMSDWAKKIDYAEIDRINKEDTPYEEKYEKVVGVLQKNFGIINPDRNGNSNPIKVKWFHYPKNSYKMQKGAPEIVFPENEEERDDYGGYYCGQERAVYFGRQYIPGERRALLSRDIGLITHEMWHAKQSDMMENNEGHGLTAESAKIRMYFKNDMAYIYPEESVKRYWIQIREKEAYMIEKICSSNYLEYKQKERYKRFFRTIGSIFNRKKE